MILFTVAIALDKPFLTKTKKKKINKKNKKQKKKKNVGHWHFFFFFFISPLKYMLWVPIETLMNTITDTFSVQIRKNNLAHVINSLV